MQEQHTAIAIDGPAAAGKSTVAKIVADKLNYIYVDTGAMYRALTLKALNDKVDPSDDDAVLDLLMNTNIELTNDSTGQRVILDGKDVTEEIRYQPVSANVSYVAKLSTVRQEMLERQRELAKDRGVVMDGRDIGTHVLPNAQVKIFLVASVDERAKRRHDENIAKGIPSDLEQLKAEIEKRDEIDSNRETAPLVRADDAIEVDTTSLSIDEVVRSILQEVEKYKDKQN
ncbi:(d)CMP kinase [Oceanobacillus alkalisoli]|uniref:(d)CMP kinase n=1 Tax=Oceanobacillus alkalisoli TaxID=2925113 RepID=UPI001EF122D5|nr:(d)CMP kinase [Oceanobacillus alkalisoli]MCF3941656.1 (d)CMP kinase [Oceanobacillus alkalisoli]MCG5102938.1 (d)CMP kinase [Oceanobacillus alkalisoli]